MRIASSKHQTALSRFIKLVAGRWAIVLVAACGSASGPDAGNLNVIALSTPSVIQVASGYQHTCAIVPRGTVICWGHAIASGGGATQAVPPQRIGGPALVTISAAMNYTCGLTSGGEAYCWGANGAGQLGDGTRTDHVASMPVHTTLRFSELAAGGLTTCGVAADHATYCWGDGTIGTVGDGVDTTNHFVLLPQRVATTRRFHHLSAGYGQACALDEDGAAYCWGAYGRFGRAAAVTVTTSVTTSGARVVSSPLTCGPYYDAGAGHCATPTLVGGGETFRSIAASAVNTCAVTVAGRAMCWGRGDEGMLGDGTILDVLIPVPVSIGAVSSITAGPLFVCALSGTGTASCWGNNFLGYLGTGPTNSSATPLLVSGNYAFSSLSASSSHVCGVSVDGRVYCWGADTAGELGQPAIGRGSDVPVVVVLPP